jgi:hypothetical protein
MDRDSLLDRIQRRVNRLIVMMGLVCVMMTAILLQCLGVL